MSSTSTTQVPRSTQPATPREDARDSTNPAAPEDAWPPRRPLQPHGPSLIRTARRPCLRQWMRWRGPPRSKGTLTSRKKPLTGPPNAPSGVRDMLRPAVNEPLSKIGQHKASFDQSCPQTGFAPEPKMTTPIAADNAELAGDESTAEPSANPSRRYTVVVARGPEDLHDHLPALDRLSTHALEPNVFYEPWVLLAAIDAFGGEASLQLILVYDQAARSSGCGELVAFFPLEQAEQFGGFSLNVLRLWEVTAPPFAAVQRQCNAHALIDEARDADCNRQSKFVTRTTDREAPPCGEQFTPAQTAHDTGAPSQHHHAEPKPRGPTRSPPGARPWAGRSRRATHSLRAVPPRQGGARKQGSQSRSPGGSGRRGSGVGHHHDEPRRQGARRAPGCPEQRRKRQGTTIGAAAGRQAHVGRAPLVEGHNHPGLGRGHPSAGARMRARRRPHPLGSRNRTQAGLTRRLRR